LIPLRDRVTSRRIPLITILLIIANGFVFIKELFLGRQLTAFINMFAVIPAAYTGAGTGDISGWPQRGVSLVTALFIHGGWIHYIGNMWYLWIFGDNVEDRLGHFRFFMFYLVCGIAGNITHIVMNSASSVPVLGASGSIAGVLGAYFLLFPGARIVTLLPVVIFWTIAEVPAVFFLGIWFALQFLNGFFSVGQTATIAWEAHIGGFITGIVLTLIFSVQGVVRKRA